MAFFQQMPTHEGEADMMDLMHGPRLDNPTVPALSPQLANHLRIAPLMAIGTIDREARVWTTLWGGQQPVAMPLGDNIVGIRTPVACRFDPVVEELVGKQANGQVAREEGKGRMVSGLTIDLETRKRVKLFGRMIAGALGARDDEVAGHSEHIAEIQLVVKVEQSLGNCPKYLNSRHIEPGLSQPELASDSIQLSQRAVALIQNADLFFVSSSHGDIDMDTNHRGGPTGFLRVASNDADGAVLVWPEYSGNRLYQTLGNLRLDPRAGLAIPDFLTGDMLYLSGTSRILVGKDAAALLPRSNLCVEMTVVAARFVTQALPFRGVPGQASPYNPIVRYLASEKPPADTQETTLQQATLLSQTILTPSISKFRFSLQNAASYKAGQYVTFDFSSHLDIGYSHMRDDDPRSLNDDFVRTFTVSRPPGDPPNPVRRLRDDEFEITIRKVGVVTDFLFEHRGGDDDRARLEIGVKGFGGEFEVQQNEKDTICFIAAGVGITPILPSLWALDNARLKLLWTIRKADIGMVLDTVREHPQLGPALTVCVTDARDEALPGMGEVEKSGATVHLRRMEKADLGFDCAISKYYLCTGTPMRKQLMDWLPEKQLIFEDFNF